MSNEEWSEKCDTEGCDKKAEWIDQSLQSASIRCTTCKNAITDTSDSTEDDWEQIKKD